MSDDTNEMQAHARKVPHHNEKKRKSYESLEDLAGIIHPRALRARIDLRDSRGIGSDEAARSSFEEMRLLGLSKSKMLGDIGKSF